MHTIRQSSTRREFLASAAVLAAVAAAPTAPAFESPTPLEARLAHDPERPQFHLLPAAGWMNDPNGPIYHNGRYHMFFQHNPHAAVWGGISWGHAVSPDMIHWQHLPVALAPSQGGPDAAGCFTGSALAVGTRVYVVYTGVVESSPEQATIRDGQNHLKESQCLAWSDDPDLIRWTKRPHPIIPDPPPGMRITGFRDPSVWKQRGGYYMTVGCGIEKVGGCVLLYRSTDLEQWTYLHRLEQGTWGGSPAANPVDSGEMWECPELFALDGGHVLIYSTEGKVIWQSGRLDTEAMVFHPLRQGLLDLDAYYAPKTQLDARGRRILWGWIPERRPVAAYAAAGWAGMMSLARVLRLDADGELRMEMLPELASLRAQPIKAVRSANHASLTLPAANGEFLVTARATSGLRCVLVDARGGQEILRVGSIAGGALIAGAARVEPDAERLRLHGFVDGSVACVMLNGRVAWTQRFYLPGHTAPAVTLQVSGAEMDVQGWRVRPISSNRLATPAAE